jgi:hypothetical protein
LISKIFHQTSKNKIDIYAVLKDKKFNKFLDEYDSLIKQLLIQYQIIENIGKETEKLVVSYL